MCAPAKTIKFAYGCLIKGIIKKEKAMEKKMSVGVFLFGIFLIFVCLFIISNTNLYSQTAPFNYVVEGNPEVRAELENEIKNILESKGFLVKSVKITVEGNKRLYKKVVANIDIVLLEKHAKKKGQYIADIKKVISKGIPDINIYRISFTFEVLPSPAPK